MKVTKAKAREPEKLGRKDYTRHLRELQTQLCHLQEWVKRTGARIIIVLRGARRRRQGRHHQGASPSASARACSAWSPCRRPPNARSRRCISQRYIQHFPAAGEIVIFDRSWYNRAGVEYVMGFCTEEQHADFLRSARISKNTSSTAASS